jgi:hypothetical protein
MAQEISSHKVKRTCDACGKEREFEFIRASKETIEEMTGWYSIVREVFDGMEFQKMIVQACCLECVPAAAVKLALPPPTPEDPPINLADLQQSKNWTN